MEDQDTQILAGKIARLLQAETQNNDFNSLQSSLEKMSQRLEAIEVKLEKRNLPLSQTNQSAKHASQEKYNNLEELADEIINGLKNEKACPFEPTGKPCDNCAMCNSHGF